MATATLQARSTSFPLLFARYLRGEIGDPLWTGLMQLLDTSDVDSTERMAFARFVNDVVSEGGPDALRVPRNDEARELLVDTRN